MVTVATVVAALARKREGRSSRSAHSAMQASARNLEAPERTREAVSEQIHKRHGRVRDVQSMPDYFTRPGIELVAGVALNNEGFAHGVHQERTPHPSARPLQEVLSREQQVLRPQQ
eukprot:CAMPEP_0170607152 /NCGR_PEP_ID=MMETSP0224-20130122/20898_1 /TAXON_ID=285029 /ORGANISM="Togula jolla, Strain CCCM 725" /LENGTH=115 /DNA_ID=CAMNT_0010932291 /DNA_START=64 /DNA_END=411 /DNA_ORIENTATION=+